MHAIVDSIARDLLAVWARAEYGCDLLSGWARGLRSKPEDEMSIVESTIDDALSYLDLVILWPKYVRAIETLEPVGAYWLFADAE